MQRIGNDRQQPAAEVALLRAHEEHEEDRHRHEDERAGAGRAHEHHRARRGAGDERHPAEPPGQRPQVVELAGGLRQPELAEVVLGGRGLVVAGRRGTRRSRASAYGLATTNAPSASSPRATRPPNAVAQAWPPAVASRAPRGAASCTPPRREQRQEHDPAGVLRRAREPEADARRARSRAGARSAGRRRVPHSESASGGERRHVVEREVRVEDRQERDRQERRGEQADAAVEEARAGEVQQPDGERPEHRGRRRARGRTPRSGRSRRRSTTPARPPNHAPNTTCSRYV